MIVGKDPSLFFDRLLQTDFTAVLLVKCLKVRSWNSVAFYACNSIDSLFSPDDTVAETETEALARF